MPAVKIPVLRYVNLKSSSPSSKTLTLFRGTSRIICLYQPIISHVNIRQITNRPPIRQHIAMYLDFFELFSLREGNIVYRIGYQIRFSSRGINTFVS
jgi:hypothetical protein